MIKNRAIEVRDFLKNPSSKTDVNLTQKMDENPIFNGVLINIDWFQCCVKFDKSFLPINSGNFKLILEPFETKEFKQVFKVLYNDIYFINICLFPKSKILPENMILVKVINEYLYLHDWIKHLNEFIVLYNLKFNNITRFDVCGDFQKIGNFKSPEGLIKQYLKGNIIKSSKSVFKVMGKQNDVLNYNYISFGSNTSVIKTYMYNKSLELKEVKSKPYIQNQYYENKFKESLDVWRLEFSIKSPIFELRDNDGVVVNSFKNIGDFSQANLEVLFFQMVGSNFKFYKNEGKKRKDRNKEIVLFNDTILGTKRIYNYYQSDGIRADKIFINKILKNDDYLRTHLPKMADDFKNNLFHYAYAKGLTDYLETKLEHYINIDKKKLKNEFLNS